jgi:hypothetical protein
MTTTSMIVGASGPRCVPSHNFRHEDRVDAYPHMPPARSTISVDEA